MRAASACPVRSRTARNARGEMSAPCRRLADANAVREAGARLVARPPARLPALIRR